GVPAGGEHACPGAVALQRLPAGGRTGGHAAAGGGHRGHRPRGAARGGAGVNPGVVPKYPGGGALPFARGHRCVPARRHMIIMFLSAEMMLQGVAINLVAFARYRGNLQGQVFTLFIITVAACEAAIALALILILYRSRKSLDVSLWQDLREPGQEAA